MSRTFGGVGPVRQSDRTRVLALVALVLVVGCVALALVLLSSSKPVETAKTTTTVVERGVEIQMVDVLVPIKEIDPGTPLEPAMFRKDKRPDVGLDQRTIHDFEEIKGQFARSLLVVNQPLHRDFITNVRPLSSMIGKIPEGYRAVTIKVDVRTSVEGFVRPDSRVDVSWISSVNGRPTLTLIVQNAKVLSIDRSDKTDPGAPAGAQPPSTATLLVTADDAQKIQLASIEGSLSLSLRGEDDKGKVVQNRGISTGQLLQGDVALEKPANCGGTLVMGGQKYCVKPGGRLEPLNE